MLHEATKNALSQVSEILNAVQGLPHHTATSFYCGTNAGKHVRHILDHFLAFIAALDEGVLDYNRRNRESDVERDWNAAQEQLDTIITRIAAMPVEATPIKIISEVDTCATENEQFDSNLPRELLYLINHTMHHTAYIRLLAQHEGIHFAEHIGIAPATASYLRQQAG